MLLKFDGSWDLMEEGIRVAYLQYADIINVSSASECDWACKTLGCVNDEFSDLFNINCVSALTKIIEHVANEGAAGGRSVQQHRSLHSNAGLVRGSDQHHR